VLLLSLRTMPYTRLTHDSEIDQDSMPKLEIIQISVNLTRHIISHSQSLNKT